MYSPRALLVLQDIIADMRRELFSTCSNGLFNELVESISTRDKAKSPLLTNLPLPMEPPTFSPKRTSTQRILEGLQSQYHDQPHDPSPTDSHPRPHSRRHRSSRSTETISAMLLIATERLSQETSRANEAERQSSEILAHFKIAHQAKQKLEVDLQRVKDELGLYKTQLNIAQAEIRRAQEIVDKVDQQRADAEDEARRGREKVRKLTEARAVELAMEEGRRLGYEEGVRQGRLMMQARDNDRNQPRRHYRRASSRSVRDDDGDQVSYFSYTQEERHSTETFRSPTNPSTPRRSSSRHRRMSDATRASRPISPASIAHPIPMASGDNASSRSKPDNNASHPQNIAIQPQSTQNFDPTMPIRPISIHNRSPTVSHRSFKLPPDGYIPTADANSFISLPPPHELSIPVPPAGAPKPSAMPTSSDGKQERKKASTSQSQGSRRSTPKSVDGDSTSHSTLSRHRQTDKRKSRPTHTRPKSEASSTHVSESSLLGTPDDTGKNKNKEEENYFNPGTAQSRIQASTQPERMAAQWRCVNSNTMPSPSPAPAAFLDRYNESASRAHGNFTIEVGRFFRFISGRASSFRPRSTDPNQRSQSRTSRRPREIVLPTPLLGTLLNPNIVQKLDHAAQETADQWQNESDRPSSSPGYARPHFVNRSVSNITVPGIEIVTPSSHTSSALSGRTVIDPVLLTPESANRPLPVLAQAQSPPTSSLGLFFNQPPSTSISGDQHRVTMALPDSNNNFPPGFFPLSPIPGMRNLDSYPSGFSPRIPKLQDEYPGGQLPSNFSYPTSPLLRSGV
ncbi:hypothetical protein BYT27DRAFT_7262318 [Phlegmacium glaucopus]|nr:hypothetical protein BYT27DRAFT_7262318 [Phlegmacium glaucopus]